MNKSTIKYIILSIISILFILFIVIIYNNIFADSNNNRYENIEEYKYTKDEKNKVKEYFSSLEQLDSIETYSNNRIINIVINLKEDVDFETIKNMANESLTNISEENLEYYDIEIFVKSNNEESEIYPQIGYKFKNNEGFSW